MELANKAALLDSYLVTETNWLGKRIIKKADGAPEWVGELVHEAHINLDLGLPLDLSLIHI